MSGRLFLAKASDPAQKRRFRMDFGEDSVRFVDAPVRPRRPPASSAPSRLRNSTRRTSPRSGRRAASKPSCSTRRRRRRGNIYRGSPRRRVAAKSLKADERERLAAGLKAVLEAGIAAGGSTLDDEAFLDPLGRPGRAPLSLAVYCPTECPGALALAKTRQPLSRRPNPYCPDFQK